MNKTITITKNLTEIEIREVRVILNDTASVTYSEIYQDGTSEVKVYTLTSDEYALWTNDDNYIKTLIESKY